MAFGQSSGPAATGKQLRDLLELLEAAGHSDFRDARGPMGFTQRQAGGKFTRDEAEEFIERLESEAHLADAPPSSSQTKSSTPPKRSSPSSRPSKSQGPQVDLTDVPVDLLAAELQRRGWIVVEP